MLLIIPAAIVIALSLLSSASTKAAAARAAQDAAERAHIAAVEKKQANLAAKIAASREACARCDAWLASRQASRA